jgi:hypothetical protein
MSRRPPRSCGQRRSSYPRLRLLRPYQRWRLITTRSPR